MNGGETGIEGGILWLVIDVGLVAILALALAYGIMVWRKGTGRLSRQRDAATRRLYRESEAQAEQEAKRQTH